MKNAKYIGIWTGKQIGADYFDNAHRYYRVYKVEKNGREIEIGIPLKKLMDYRSIPRKLLSIIINLE